VGRKDVVEFYHRHVVPRNSVLMVVGRVDKAEFRKKIEAAFGEWRGDAPTREWKQSSDARLTATPGQVVLIDRPGLTQAQVRIGFLGPKIDVPERHALLVANALLGEYFGSRLNAEIRDKLGLTYSITSSFQFARDIGRFVIASATRNEQAGQMLKKTLEILRELKSGPIPGEEVKMAKDYLVGGYPLSVATLGAVASRWLAGYVFNLGPDYLNEFVPKVEAVTRDEVKAAVGKHFDLSRLVIVIAGDGKQVSKSLAEAGFANVKRATAKDLL
jgi:zinc protease